MRLRPAQIVVLFIALGAGGIAAMIVGSNRAPPAVAPVAPVTLETTDVLVANADLGTGHKLSAQDLRWEVWPAAAAGAPLVRKSDRPNAIEELAGSMVRTAFERREPIRQSKLILASKMIKSVGSSYMAANLTQGKHMRAISVDIGADTGASGFILPNDHIDVILTRDDKVAERTSGLQVITSETILEDVRVLAIGQNVELKEGKEVIDGKQATLELTQQQAETLALAHRLGTITLALRSLDDFDSGDRPKVAAKDKPEVATKDKQVATNDSPKAPSGPEITVIRFGHPSYERSGADLFAQTRTPSPAQIPARATDAPGS